MIASHQRIGIFTCREFARFLHGLLQITLEISGQFLVIPRNGRVRRKIQDVRQIVSAVEFRGLKVQNGRDQRDAVEIHPIAAL